MRNTNPNSASFSNVLTADQIAQLPDDPEEFENAINQLAGPGSQIRVNGFRGGKLPPKSQIREIRFRLNPYAAENHDAGFGLVDVITKPGVNSWHGSLNVGFRDEAMNARQVFAPFRGRSNSVASVSRSMVHSGKTTLPCFSTSTDRCSSTRGPSLQRFPPERSPISRTVRHDG